MLHQRNYSLGKTILFITSILYCLLLIVSTQSPPTKYQATRLPRIGTPPEPRKYYGFTTIDTRLYIYGGEGFSDLWVLVLDDPEDIHWEQIPFDQNAPSPKMTSGTQMFATDTAIYLFGGQVGDFALVSIVIVYLQS
jgi:hypothetical protein